MLHRIRSALTPGYLLLHLLTAAAAVTMVLLGRWQLTVSNRKHFDLQNFGYALQWWAFTAFALALWGRIVRDALRTADRSRGAPPAEPAAGAAPPVPYRRYVMPQDTPVPGDAEQAAYNDYLARLDAQARAGDGTERTTP